MGVGKTAGASFVVCAGLFSFGTAPRLPLQGGCLVVWAGGGFACRVVVLFGELAEGDVGDAGGFSEGEFDLGAGGFVGVFECGYRVGV